MEKYTVEEFLLTYHSWQSMMQRCVYKGVSRTTNFKNYVGRGVLVDPRWHNFETFIQDLGPRPNKGYTLDRFPDNNAGYVPGNCRWATRIEQAANTRQAKLLSFKGETLPLAAWARKTGLGRGTINYRLSLGWSVEKALTTAPQEKNPSYRTWAEGRKIGRKLDAEKVEQIVEKAKTATYTAAALAKEYGVSGVAICHVLKQFGIHFKKGRPRRKKDDHCDNGETSRHSREL